MIRLNQIHSFRSVKRNLLGLTGRAFSASSYDGTRQFSSKFEDYDDETESMIERSDIALHSDVEEETEGEWAGCKRQFFAPLRIQVRGPGEYSNGR